MQAGASPDWRDGAAYAPLLAADRSIFAWEWLRRSPDYQAAAAECLGRNGDAALADGPPSNPARWGLHRFEMPDRAAPEARPVWRREAHPFVLQATAWPSATGPDALDLGAIASAATLVRSSDGAEHLLLSDGLRALRIDILRGSIAERPARLRFQLEGIISAEPPLLTLRRLLVFCRTGQFGAALHPREKRAARWISMLRAHDGLASGARQREIAAVLFGDVARNQRWRVEASTLRLQAQRLVRSARVMASGGYVQLLRA